MRIGTIFSANVDLRGSVLELMAGNTMSQPSLQLQVCHQYMQPSSCWVLVNPLRDTYVMVFCDVGPHRIFMLLSPVHSNYLKMYPSVHILLHRYIYLQAITLNRKKYLVFHSNFNMRPRLI
jgi:hypothetical protein